MKIKSLSFRLVASSALWSLLVLGIAGLILSGNYRQSVEKNFDERLNIHLKALIAEVDVKEDKSLLIERALGDTRFEVPYSGWYWQIRDSEGNLALSSKSLFDAKLDVNHVSEQSGAAYRVAYINGPQDQVLRTVSRPISLPEFKSPHMFTVAGDAAEIEAEVASFIRILVLGLATLAVGLLLALFIQIRFGLKPLKQVKSALEDIRAGEAQELKGRYPSEISPLVSELNSLLKANREVVERARTHVGNLAHSLKTPLSVLSNEVQSLTSAEQSEKMASQVKKMRDQITHHLDRAQMAARTKTFGLSTPVRPVIESISRALLQINKTRGIELSHHIPEALVFAGEKQDLEEIVGNVLENAFKWAKKDIHIEIQSPQKPADGEGQNFFTLRVIDDGPGLSQKEAGEALKRGKRLDESKPGSGLGLSIVTELVDIYGGNIALKSSKNSGLCVEITLPEIS